MMSTNNCGLLEETDENKFYILLENTLKNFADDDEQKSFYEYFTEYYVPKVKLWALFSNIL